MKKYLLFLTLLSTIILSAQNTLQGKVFYTVSIKPFTEQQVDSLLNKRKTNKRAQLNVKKMLMNSKDVTSILTFTNNESLYKVEDKMKNDKNKGLNMTATIAGNKSLFYINTSKKDYFKQIDYSEFLRVGLPENKWTITQETKKIGDYVCFKAILFKKVRENRPAVKTIAWFAPSLPVSFGPKDYFGLPGLILEVSYKTFSIKASKIILNPTDKINVIKPTKGKRITHEKYQKMNRDFFKNLRK